MIKNQMDNYFTTLPQSNSLAVLIISWIHLNRQDHPIYCIDIDQPQPVSFALGSRVEVTSTHFNYPDALGIVFNVPFTPNTPYTVQLLNQEMIDFKPTDPSGNPFYNKPMVPR